MKKNIGIFGGSFDPIHHGHLRAAIEILEQHCLNEIRFIPCGQHAFHKKFQASNAQRLAMLKLAIKNDPRFTIDERELHDTEPSYTLNTLNALDHDFPNTTFYLILGEDTFQQFSAWHEFEAILKYHHLIVVQRSSDPVKIPEELKDFSKKINFVNIPIIDISSTYIRQQCRQKKNIRYLAPEVVVDFIERENIYAS
jgi:nicotinate-nucleotide adenylyltransferase